MAVCYGVISMSLVRNSDFSNEKIKMGSEDRITQLKYKLKGLKLFKYLGPAFIISVAYVDPANSL